MIPELNKIVNVIENAENILIIQADNPDGDSLASSLALEQILGDMGKNVSMYCGVNVPDYLKFMPGWDRVSQYLPLKIDATIIVDTSASILLKKLDSEVGKPWVTSKPVIVIDHHAEVKCDIPYASIVCNPSGYVATGEVLYDLAKSANWALSTPAMNMLAQSILSDSLGLSSDGTTPGTYRRMADLIDAGVDRVALEDARRELSRMQEPVFRYKAKLIERTEFFADNQIAFITVPEDELFSIGTLYNPKPLILNELVQVQDVRIAIMLKLYKNRITGSVRSTDKLISANKLAEQFGGGGHHYVAGFKIEKPSVNFTEIKKQVIAKAQELLG